MAHIDECVPGQRARILRSGVARVVGKTGTIVEVSRIRRPASAPLKDTVTVDVPGHGEIAVAPSDLEIVQAYARSEFAFLHFLEQPTRLGVLLRVALPQRGIELHRAIALGLDDLGRVLLGERGEALVFAFGQLGLSRSWVAGASADEK